ncbi:MAG: START domain-containing protein [Pedobacter sp.]|nr:START domain-containing protein [Pedobacter sp.]
MPATFFTLLLAFFIGLMPMSSHAEANWQAAGNKNGIKVWKRPVAGSPFVEFKAETTVSSTLSALLNLFYDLDAAPQWLDGTRRVVAVRRDDVKHEYILLIETDMPWPLQDRDAVLSGRWQQDPQSLTISLRSQSVEGIVPVNPKYIRNNIRNDWTFIPQGNGKVKVVMGGHVDPGGNLPDWAVNMLIQESPLRTLANLKRMIADPKRQAEKFTGVIEPAADFAP